MIEDGKTIATHIRHRLRIFFCVVVCAVVGLVLFERAHLAKGRNATAFPARSASPSATK